jgi:hypothetical protein
VPVPLGLYITSQFFGVLCLISVFAAYQIKDKGKTLLVMILANIFMIACAGFLTDWVGAAMGAVGCTRCGVFFLVEKYRDKITKPYMYLILFALLSLCCVSVYFTYSYWFDLIMLAAWMLFIYGTWMRGVHLIRITQTLYSITVIIHYIFFMNYLGMANEAAGILSISIFYISKLVKRKRV